MGQIGDGFGRRLRQQALRVERMLETELERAAGPAHEPRPERLLAAMRHAALAGGKRLRPLLTIETAAMLGATGTGPLRTGVAIECLHCYSLVHDDLPAMDDDDLRRGKPTVHRAYDEATAILAGDALMTLAFEILAHPRTHADAAVRAELVLGLACAAGVSGMAGGQMLDLAAEGRFGQVTCDVAHVRRLQAMKTGALIAFSVEAGAIAAGADAPTRKRCRNYGVALGAAFQIADDLLDREANATEIGKATRKDQNKGKGTLVDLIGVEQARAEARALADEAIRLLRPFGPEAGMLRAAARFAVERRI